MKKYLIGQSISKFFIYLFLILGSLMMIFPFIWMILTSFLLVFLGRGAGEIATDFGLNSSFGDILTGVILFFIIGSEFFINYKLQFRKSSANKKQGEA